MHANEIYQKAIRTILCDGVSATTRNHPVIKHVTIPEFIITSTPLITFRKTAWRKALREWEWFMSGNEECPADLLDWWNGQLSPFGHYLNGYSYQLRSLRDCDQIANIFAGLRKHPNSRRLVATTWNAVDMANITEDNNNPLTPTCCHGTVIQFHVVGNKLHLYTYQRSADMLLGLPHNLIQYWAFLLYVAHHTNYKPGQLTYKLGDAHIYDEPSHVVAAEAIAAAELPEKLPTIIYDPPYNLPKDKFGGPEFRARDFELVGVIPHPVTDIRPVLL